MNERNTSGKSKKHRNIPVFIPHYGCKNECIFCNQKIITGNKNLITEKFIAEEIDKNLKYRKNAENTETEIAFFGGSFTGIERKTMILSLEIAYKYVKSGVVDGIRISTRPDYISDEILSILKKYGVKSIELGIQSMFDDVLCASKRGHTVRDTVKACEMICGDEYKFNLTGQMMTGLYKSNEEKDIETAKKIVDMGATSARIYPVIVIKDTELYSLRQKGEYRELSLDEAVSVSAKVKRIFDNAGVKVLRTGLCATDVFSDTENFIGPFHPAFGELVESKICIENIILTVDKIISEKKDVKTVKIVTNNKNISKIVGQNGQNRIQLKDRYKEKNIEVKIVVSDKFCDEKNNAEIEYEH